MSYANEAKTELLGVPAALIEAHGAVSPEVAAAMAEGCAIGWVPTLGLSTTGVAGPRAEQPKSRSGWSTSAWQRPKAPRPAGSTSARISRATSSSSAPKAALNWVRLTLLAVSDERRDLDSARRGRSSPSLTTPSPPRSSAAWG